MEKVTINIVVPERIMALVQNYLQRIVFGDNKEQFLDFLKTWGVFEPEQYLSEMEIGIIHPDDEEPKILSFDSRQYQDVSEYLSKCVEPTYFDKEIGEHLYSIDCLEGVVFHPPIKVLDFVESVKFTGCSYFRFLKV